MINHIKIDKFSTLVKSLKTHNKVHKMISV